MIHIFPCLRFSMFQMVIERLFLPELAKIEENDKKLCAVGVTHILCDPLPMITGVYFNHLWLPLLQALLQLFESSNELQTMSAAERKKQLQEEAEEELLVGLDDTPGKKYFAYSNALVIRKERRIKLDFVTTYTYVFLSITFLYFRLYASFFVFGFCEKVPYGYIRVGNTRCSMSFSEMFTNINGCSS